MEDRAPTRHHCLGKKTPFQLGKFLSFATLSCDIQFSGWPNFFPKPARSHPRSIQKLVYFVFCRNWKYSLVVVACNNKKDKFELQIDRKTAKNAV